MFKRSSMLALGITDRTEPTWTMSPDRTPGMVRIAGGINGSLRITVQDGSGRVVSRAEGIRELDLSGLAPGSYSVRLEADGERSTRLLVKL